MKIIMYTGNNCGKCKRAKAMFGSLPVDVEIIEKNVDNCSKCMKELEKLGSSSLPTFKLEDGSVLIGFDENIGKLMEVFGL